MEFQKLLEKVKDHVVSYFEVHHDPELTYHDLKHTQSVVTSTTKIADHYQLSDEDFFTVITAAWFHDAGYLTNKKDHEAKSIELADNFLKELKVDGALIEKVEGCIRATKIPQKPLNRLEEILCDADLFHLGTDKFEDKTKQLRKEIEAVKHLEINKQQWRQKNIELLGSHRYFTDFAQLLLNGQQEKNLQQLKHKQESANENDKPVAPPAEKALPDAKEKKPKSELPEKGIETMFRITSGNNQRLSDMADGKAHILITVNSIILSAIISLVLKKLGEDTFLALPSFILLTVSLLSMIFSILATRPTVPKGTFNQADIDTKTVNLLFFGNFYKMGFDDYTNGMLKVMGDKDFLYGTLIKDVYSQGVVLGKKYLLLRVAYNIFMFGLVVAVVAFIVSSIIHDRIPPVTLH